MSAMSGIGRLHRSTRWVGCLLAAAMLAACGTLTVTMEVLNPVEIEHANDANLLASIPKLSLASDDAIQRGVDELRAVHKGGYLAIQKAYYADAEKIQDPELAKKRRADGDKLLADFDATVRDFYRALRNDLKRYRDDLNLVLGKRYTVSPTDEKYDQVVTILRTWQQRNRQASIDIRANIGKFVQTKSNPGGVLSAEQAESIGSQIVVAQASIEQVSIQNSPYAYAVAGAASEAWKTYNKVHTDGRLGATDVAIKLDAKTGNYMLKGMSFDPSDVAAIASKVTTQALLLSAQIAGVPVKGTTPPVDGTAGKALVESSSALANAQAELETRRAQDAARKNAMISLAHAILNEEADLKKDATAPAAVAALKSAFEQRKPLLSAPAASAP